MRAGPPNLKPAFTFNTIADMMAAKSGAATVLRRARSSRSGTALRISRKATAVFRAMARLEAAEIADMLT
jgi:hypothetical protein